MQAFMRAPALCRGSDHDCCGSGMCIEGKKAAASLWKVVDVHHWDRKCLSSRMFLPSAHLSLSLSLRKNKQKRRKQHEALNTMFEGMLYLGSNCWSQMFDSLPDVWFQFSQLFAGWGGPQDFLKDVVFFCFVGFLCFLQIWAEHLNSPKACFS